MKNRQRSIRSKIIAMVAFPLAAFLALWIFATVLTVGPALRLLSARDMVTQVGNPGQALVSELQRERSLSVQFLSRLDPVVKGEVPEPLIAQRAATDRAAEAFRKSAGDVRDQAEPQVRAHIDQLLSDAAGLPDQRVHIDLREMDPIGAQGVYNASIDVAFEMFHAAASFGDEQVDSDIDAIATIGRGQEYLARVDSLQSGAIVAGVMTEGSRAELVQDIGVGRFLLADGVDELPGSDRAAFQRLTQQESWTRLDEMLDQLASRSRTGSVSPVSGDDWYDTWVPSSRNLRDFEASAVAGLAERTTPVAIRILTRLIAAGLLGLVALVLAVVLSVRVGRSIIDRLRRLRAEAHQMSAERLPGVVQRLRRGEAVDVDAETPELNFGRDEIGELGRAFNDVRRTAVQSAVEEANVRRGLNEVFLNIARRSQTLLHRQLAMLDKMERRETEPQELEDLYRVDHLATRMRRHAEDLVILAGAAPGRGWRNPVPVIDVVRGAISEVEDYQRIDIRTVQASAVLGRAVTDVIHLLAELLENAASFSPPDTRVLVTGRREPDGYAVEIEDRGLGMTPEALDEANRRLFEPPDFDPADSARLGLFVVGRLADRHGIKVSLRASPESGVTAVILVPATLMTATPGRVTVGGPGRKAAPVPRQRQAGPEPATRQRRAAPEPVRGDPVRRDAVAASTADGVSAEGLVQRRRAVPRNAVPRNSAPGNAAAAVPESTEDGLPKRVRQANLVPQLRRSSAPQPAEEPVAAVRSPEQVRSLMSALQRGTTRGRRDAAVTPPEGSFADAATVSFPAIVNHTPDRGAPWNGAGTDADSDGAGRATPRQNRPEKDAQ